jgi:hypothetical protein
MSVPAAVETLFNQIIADRPKKGWTGSRTSGNLIRESREIPGRDIPLSQYTAAQQAQEIVGTNYFIRAHDAKKKRLLHIVWNPVAGVYRVGQVECIVTKAGDAQAKRNAPVSNAYFSNVALAVEHFDKL